MPVDKKYILILFCMVAAFLSAQNKYAFLVGISEYPNVGEDAAKWTDIHGANDVQLLAGTLEKQGFTIKTLQNNQCTAKNIRSQIETLIKLVHTGDIVYIHFSSHGQPVEDMSGDEDDGWDEAIVPYDAEMMFRKGIYEGKNHILDDEVGSLIKRIGDKLGSEGKCLVVVDACHAGTSSRDDEYPDNFAPTRGTNMGFSESKFYRPRRVSQSNTISLESKCNVIVLEACLPTQRNIEIQVGDLFYGPLSYSINQLLPSLSFSKRWIDSVRSTMQSNLPSWSKQEMVVETNVK